MRGHAAFNLLAIALVTGTLAMGTTASGVLAQTQDNTVPPATNQTPGLPAPPETRPGEPARAVNPGGVPNGAPTRVEAVNIATAVHSDDLIGATVRNDRNDSIGTVDALLISPDGKVAGVVLDVGGFLGIGGRQVVVPMDELSMTGKDVRLDRGTRETLQTLPPYQRRGKSSTTK